MVNSKIKGNLLIFLTAFLWSFLGTITKYVSTGGILITGITSFAAFIVIRLCLIKHKLQINKITMITGVIMAGMNLMFFLANKLTTVTNTIVLQYSSPVFVLLLNILLLHYRPSKKQMAVLAVCMTGMIVFFSDQLSSGNMLGNVLALISGFLFAGTFFLNSMPENDPSSSMMIHHLVSFTFAFCYALLTHDRPVPGDIGLLVFTGIFMAGFPSVFYSLGMRFTSALNANMIALSEVFMAPIWALLIFHERMGRFSLLGIVMMLASIVYECVLENRPETAVK